MRRLLPLLAGLLATLSISRADDAELTRALGADTHAAREAAEKAKIELSSMKLPTLFIELSIFCPAVSAVDWALSIVLLSARAEPLTRTLPRVTASRVFEIFSLVIFIDLFLCLPVIRATYFLSSFIYCE